ncbi:helix-turn-helix domain-containing protein [Aliarcobacter butzleri]|uniref:helix-turn-helix domain-containing protein n=1 Tax=Aliarcobacter butzleri TaxID=28197 RepID=UPI00263E88C8|nr:helix-turn-helix domain-containing protein [Aliarcobacter butzleri]MDN5086185.1 helix-turn-helix domain-containing protein [Aliarcobacter butzleri]
MNEQLIDKYLSDINELGFEKTLILDTHDVAKILKVKARTVVNWAKAKENIGPKCKKIGKSYLYTKRDVAEFLAQN